MKLAADFRTQARQALRGKWLMAVLAGLLAALLGGTALEGPEIKFNFNPGAGVGRVSLNYVGRELASVGMDMDLRFSGWLVGAPICSSGCSSSCGRCCSSSPASWPRTAMP